MAVNSNRFINPTLNPAHLPVPDAIEALDQEQILADRMADFQRRADAVGFPYDVGELEFDPIKVDQEAHAHREGLMRARVNSAVRAVLPAYAQGADLDAIVARANITRLMLDPGDPANGVPPVMESDANLLVRYLTGFAVPAAGSPDGYIYAAATAYPIARDISVVGPEVHRRPGRAVIYVLGEVGQPITSDVLQTIRAAVTKPNVKPLTDEAIVAAAEVIPYEVEHRILVPRGPAPSDVAAAVKVAVQKAAHARFAIGAQVYANVLEGAAYVGNVIKVTRSKPLADIVTGPSQAALCTNITINVEIAP